MPRRLIAVSASYGALGSEICPLLAERLRVPFVDRAIPMGVAARLNIPVEEADVDEQQGSPSFLERVLRSFASAEPTTGPVPLGLEAAASEDFHHATEEVLRRQAEAGQGVLLGRGAVIVLHDDPRVLRVRFDGPVEERVRQVMQRRGLDRQSAEQARRALDRVHEDYARRFYGVDLRDPALYHLVIDSTALPVEACVEIVAVASAA